MVRADWKFKEWEWDDEMTLYHVAKTGIFGAICAVLAHLLPFPRGSMGEARRQLNHACSNSMLGMSFMVKSFLHGQTKQERVKAMRYIDELTRNLQQVEQLLGYAVWEPYQQRHIYKYKVLISTLHQLRANLCGMQQALKYWDITKYEGNRKRVCKEMEKSMLRLSTQAFRVLDGAFVLVTEDKIWDPAREKFVAPEDSWLSIYGLDDSDDTVTRATPREKFKRKLTGKGRKVPDDHEQLGADQQTNPNVEVRDAGLLTGYAALQSEFKKFDQKFLEVRFDSRDKVGEELEKDQWMHTFLCSYVSFCDAISEFPEEYSVAWEAKVNESKASEFVPDSKIVAVYFQKRFIISGLKTAIALVIAIMINIYYFNYEYEAPVIICYVMAGHYGGSYSVTISRSLGVLGGMILGFMVIIASECNQFNLCVGYVLVIASLAFIRRSSTQHSYAAFVVRPPQHGLSSNKMALITSYCDAMRNHEHQMALITSECVPQASIVTSLLVLRKCRWAWH